MGAFRLSHRQLSDSANNAGRTRPPRLELPSRTPEFFRQEVQPSGDGPQMIKVLAYDLASGDPKLQEIVLEASELEQYRRNAVFIGGQRVPVALLLAIILSVLLFIALIFTGIIVFRRKPQFPTSSPTPPPLVQNNSSAQSDSALRAPRFQWLRNLSTSAFSARADSTTLGSSTYKEIGSRSAPELTISAPNNGSIEDVWRNVDEKDIERGILFPADNSSFATSTRSKPKSRDSGWEAQIPDYRPSTAPTTTTGYKNPYLSLIQDPILKAPKPVYTNTLRASIYTETDGLQLDRNGNPLPIQQNLQNLRYSGTLLPLSVANARLKGSNPEDLVVKQTKVIPSTTMNGALPISAMQTVRDSSPVDQPSSAYPINDPRRPSEDSGRSTPTVLFPLRAPPKNPRRLANGPPLSPPPSSPLPEPPMSPMMPLSQSTYQRRMPSPTPTVKGRAISPPELIIPPTVNSPALIPAPTSPKSKKLARKKSWRKMPSGSRDEGRALGVEYSQWDDSSDEERFKLGFGRKGTVKKGKAKPLPTNF